MSVAAEDTVAAAVLGSDTFRPESEEALAALLADTAGPVRVQGGGTRPVGTAIDAPVLSTASIEGIVRHDAGALTLVAKAGTPLAEVETQLASAGQRLPFEPADYRRLLGRTGTPTIGGVVAANSSGPRRIQAGACRDSLIGVRFVDGAGRVIKNGGRVMKNVTGYDLVKLMAGSYGTLGVLTEVSFKVLPSPEASATLRIAGLDVPQAVAALSAGLTSPYEVTGAAHLPPGLLEASGTLLRIEGLAASVGYRTEQLMAELAHFGSAEVIEDRDASAQIWVDIRDAAPFAGREGDVWRISVRPSDAPAIVARLESRPHFLDWGGGLIWVLCDASTDLRAVLGDFRGHATLLRAEAGSSLPVFHPEPAPLAALATRLRASFDPRGILNPGLMA